MAKYKSYNQNYDDEYEEERAKRKRASIGIVIIAVAGLAVVLLAVKLFSSSGDSGGIKFKEEADKKSQIAVYGDTTADDKSIKPLNDVSTVDYAGGEGSTSDENSTYTRTEETADSTVEVVDVSGTNKAQEEKFAQEVAKMRKSYQDSREALKSEAVGFLQGNHDVRAVNVKAENFSKLATDLRAKIGEFPASDNGFQRRFWDEQIKEIEKSASFLDNISSKLRGTSGDARKMKMAASSIKTMSVE